MLRPSAHARWACATLSPSHVGCQHTNLYKAPHGHTKGAGHNEVSSMKLSLHALPSPEICHGCSGHLHMPAGPALHYPHLMWAVNTQTCTRPHMAMRKAQGTTKCP